MSEAFIKYVGLLAHLHHAMISGLDDGDGCLGDQLRDEMDLVWRRMSDTEQQLCDKISAEIYSVQKSFSTT